MQQGSTAGHKGKMADCGICRSVIRTYGRKGVKVGRSWDAKGQVSFHYFPVFQVHK